MQRDFEFPELIEAMGELVRKGLPTILPVLFALVALGFGVDYVLGDETGSVLIISIGQFVISYFLVVGLARDSGLLGENEDGPGFGSYFGLAFVMGLGIGVGFLLLVIPGIFLTIRWLLAFPILFSPDDYGEEGKGSLGQSFAWTGPVAWKLTAAWIIGFLLSGVSLLAYSWMGFAPDQMTMIIGYGVANLAAALNTVYTLVLGFAAFLLLRDDKAELEEVFS